MDKTSNKYCVPCICLALVLAIVAVYWQVLVSEFVTFDDPHYVSENQYVRTGFTRNNIIWAFTRLLASVDVAVSYAGLPALRAEARLSSS